MLASREHLACGWPKSEVLDDGSSRHVVVEQPCRVLLLTQLSPGEVMTLTRSL